MPTLLSPTEEPHHLRSSWNAYIASSHDVQ